MGPWPQSAYGEKEAGPKVARLRRWITRILMYWVQSYRKEPIWDHKASLGRTEKASANGSVDDETQGSDD